MIRDSPEASSSSLSAAATLLPLVNDSDNVEEDDTIISVDKVRRSSPIMLVDSDYAECDEPDVNTPISPVSLTPSPSPSPAPLLPEVSVTETEDVFEFSEIDSNR